MLEHVSGKLISISTNLLPRNFISHESTVEREYSKIITVDAFPPKYERFHILEVQIFILMGHIKSFL